MASPSWTVMLLLLLVTMTSASSFASHGDYLTEVPTSLIDPTASVISITNSLIKKLEKNTFKPFTQLTTLILSYNRIIHIAKTAFIKTNMSIIKLDHNRLTKMPKFIGIGESLRSLDLSFNYLTRLEDISFTTVTGLQDVNLSHNRITFIAPDALVPFQPSLRNLSLNFNLLEDIPGYLFEELSLEMLNLGHNRLAKLPNLTSLNHSLNELDLEGNHFSEITCHELLKILMDLPQLTIFDFSRSGLIVFPDIFFLKRKFKRVRLLNPHAMHCDCAMTWMIDLESRVEFTDITASSTPCATPHYFRDIPWANITQEDLCQVSGQRSCTERPDPTENRSTSLLHSSAILVLSAIITCWTLDILTHASFL